MAASPCASSSTLSVSSTGLDKLGWLDEHRTVRLKESRALATPELPVNSYLPASLAQIWRRPPFNAPSAHSYHLSTTITAKIDPQARWITPPKHQKQGPRTAKSRSNTLVPSMPIHFFLSINRAVATGCISSFCAVGCQLSTLPGPFSSSFFCTPN